MPRSTNHRRPPDDDERKQRRHGRWNFSSIGAALARGGHYLGAAGYRQSLYYRIEHGRRKTVRLHRAHEPQKMWTSQEFVKWRNEFKLKVELDMEGREQIVPK